MGKRVALVIGVDNYENVVPLERAVNGARDVAAMLQKLGFTLIGKNPDGDTYGPSDQKPPRYLADEKRPECVMARCAFFDEIADADIALFYFSGHGVQVDGSNYLLAKESQVPSPGDLNDLTLPLAPILDEMSHNARHSIIVLDACRNDPFKGRYMYRQRDGRRAVPGADPGLAKIELDGRTDDLALRTIHILFSTEPGRTAVDKLETADQTVLAEVGHNSPFTAALLKHIDTPGLTIGSLVNRIGTTVRRWTKDEQRPWHNYLPGPEVVLRPIHVLPDLPEDWRTAWDRVKKSATPDIVRAFMEKYPNSPAIGEARELLAFLLARNADAWRTGWEKAKTSPFPEVLQSFMDRFPNAPVIGEASARLAELMMRPAAAGVLIELGKSGKRGRAWIGWLAAASVAGTLLLNRETVYDFLDSLIKAPDPKPTESWLDNISRGLAGTIEEAAAFEQMVSSGTLTAEKRKAITAVLRLLERPIITLPVPPSGLPQPGEGCRLRFNYDAGADPMPNVQICRRLGEADDRAFVNAFAAVPKAIWDLPELVSEKQFARKIFSDLWAALGNQDAAIQQLRANLGIVNVQRANLVTLQFGGEFLRGNAAIIRERLIALGLRIDGVDREASAAGRNEVRYGDTAGTQALAEELATDLETAGVKATTQSNRVIGSSRNLDIYISKPAPQWQASQPLRAGWCFQRQANAAEVGSGWQYSIRCHATQIECQSEVSATRTNGINSSCRFLPFLDEAKWSTRVDVDAQIGYGGGPLKRSYYKYSPIPFPAPFPQLPR